MQLLSAYDTCPWTHFLNPDSTRYLGAGLMLASLLPLSHGSRLFSAQSAYVQQSSERTARVVDHIVNAASRPASGNKEVFSIVEFSDDDGNGRTARTNVASYPPPSAVGDEILIRTHHTRTDDVRVASFAGLWLESTFYLVPGALTLIAGAWLVMKKQRSPEGRS